MDTTGDFTSQLDALRKINATQLHDHIKNETSSAGYKDLAKIEMSNMMLLMR